MGFWGRINFMKGGLVHADALTTVSPGYSREIQTPEYGMGLDGVLRQRAPESLLAFSMALMTPNGIRLTMRT